ncbi:hypothetical protein ACLKA6_004646 [Drosophila palustris]
MVTRTKKIFVGGLSAPTTLEDVKSYFEQFGPHVNWHLRCLIAPAPTTVDNANIMTTPFYSTPPNNWSSPPPLCFPPI